MMPKLNACKAAVNQHLAVPKIKGLRNDIEHIAMKTPIALKQKASASMLVD